MRFSSRLSILRAKDEKQEIIVGTDSILARVIDIEVAETKASFLTLARDI